jgi:hypothetical protein
MRLSAAAAAVRRASSTVSGAATSHTAGTARVTKDGANPAKSAATVSPPTGPSAAAREAK